MTTWPVQCHHTRAVSPQLGEPTCPRHSTGASSLHIPLEHNGLATSWWQATNPGLTHIMSASPTPMQPQQEATLHSQSSEGLTPPPAESSKHYSCYNHLRTSYSQLTPGLSLRCWTSPCVTRLLHVQYLYIFQIPNSWQWVNQNPCCISLEWICPKAVSTTKPTK